MDSFYSVFFTSGKRENQVRHLKDDKSRLENEVEELEKKIERMGTMQKQVCICNLQFNIQRNHYFWTESILQTIITAVLLIILIIFIVLQKGPAEAVQHELEELRKKNRQLQEELKRSKHQPEKPYEQHIPEMVCDT